MRKYFGQVGKLKENKIDGESYITKIVYVDNILLGYLALCYFQ